MTDQFRAMCAELLAWAEHTSSHYYKQPDVLNRARALLDQQPVSPPYKLPEPERPTDEELLRVAATAIKPYEISGITPGEYEPETEYAVEAYGSELIAYARAAIARWGRPTPQPEGGDIHYAWELHDAEGDWQAGGSAITLESVRREGNHYLQTFSQDGPHTLIIQRVSTIEEVTND